MEYKLKILKVPVTAEIYLTTEETLNVWRMKQVVDIFDDATLNTAIEQYIMLCIHRKVVCN